MKKFMFKALEIAAKSGEDLPVGAVLTKDGQIVAAAHNEKEQTRDVTAHAEILAIKAAQEKFGTNLSGCELYVTLEPCPMCAWAILESRISKVVFGANNPLYGAFGGKIDLRKLAGGKTSVFGGIEEEACETLLKNCFKKLREQPRRTEFSAETTNLSNNTK